eukprot:TRINITY_DN5676_c0_g1_i12.p1 TRINITY_DN5676_c0_g1~~TRINITY_DN5676_c0_g1_i12.p1  ORF type:complete len:396 (-),score=72.63 TRINITY_DN5676_c0_g1_i12:1143-2330(-)
MCIRDRIYSYNAEMFKPSTQRIEVLARVYKENFDDQYGECINYVSMNELDLTEKKPDEMLFGREAFVSRSKLQYSPEQKLQQMQAEESQPWKSGSQKMNFDKFVDQKQPIRYAFDNVVRDKEANEEFFTSFAKSCVEELPRRGNIVIVSLSKSNLIISQGQQSNQMEQKETQHGLLCTILAELSTSLQYSNEGYTITLTTFTTSQQLTNFTLETSTSADLKERKTSNDQQIEQAISKTLQAISSKRLNVPYVCYEIEVIEHSPNTQRRKVILVDIIQIVEKSNAPLHLERNDSKTGEKYCAIINLLLGLTSIKDKQSPMSKDKFLQAMSRAITHKSKIYIIGNVRNAQSLYVTNKQVLDLLRSLLQQREVLNNFIVQSICEVFSCDTLVVYSAIS